MRTILLGTMLLTACSKPAPAPVTTGLKPELYMAADGRGRLCVGPDGKSAAIIAFAAGSPVNCSASGRVEGAGATAALVPAGEGACRIPLRIEGDTVTVGSPGPSCDYYCGPGAAWSGQVYRWGDTSTAETLAEPLMPADNQC